VRCGKFSRYEKRFPASRNLARKSLSCRTNIYIFYKTQEHPLVF
jgi:hypothetical protein